jgi:hypothetical protein
MRAELLRGNDGVTVSTSTHLGHLDPRRVLPACKTCESAPEGLRGKKMARNTLTREEALYPQQTYVIPWHTNKDASIGGADGCITAPKICKVFEGEIVRLS